MMQDIYAAAEKKAEDVSYEDSEKRKNSIYIGRTIKPEAGAEKKPLKSQQIGSDKPEKSENKTDGSAVGGFAAVQIVSEGDGSTKGSTKEDPVMDDDEVAQSTTLSIVGITQTNKGQEFSLDIYISNASYVASIPFYFNYDSNLLTFVSASEGSFLNSDGHQTSFITSNDAVKGRLIVGLSRLGDPKGISGQGSVMKVNLRAEKAGNAVTRINNALVIGNGGVQIPLAGYEKNIDIQ